MKNKITLILDASGSMSHVRSKVIETANKLVEKMKTESEAHKQRTEFTLVTFDDDVKFGRFKDVNIKKVEVLNKDDYVIGGMTALYDALGKSITDYKVSQDYDDEDCSFVIILITDGLENASKMYNHLKLSRLIKEVNGTDRFTVTVQTPSGSETSLTSLGIGRDNITSFTASNQGLQESVQKTSDGLTKFYGSRSAGLKSVKSFYTQTDATQVTKRDLSSLQKISNYQIVNVFNVSEIKPLVESFGIPYTQGCAYYQLTKPETISHKKEVLIQDSSGNVYSGQHARSLVGLIDGVDAKVTPGNHGQYTIYVQSTSVNRKLMPNTKVIVWKK